MEVETVTFDQVHLGVPDPEAAARWYRQYLGATAGEHTDRVMFAATRFIFLKNDTPVPSQGASIDHVGLSFVDLAARMEALAGSGMRLTAPVSDMAGLYRSAFIEDPWGARIEVMDDPDTHGLHHVHLQVPDPAASRRWYIERLGGEAAKLKGTLDGVKFGDVWVIADGGASVPSRGHTIDHIGWRMPDLLKTAAFLKTQGVSFTTEPHPGPNSPHAPVLMSFMEDPWGVKIELLQRRDAAA